MNLVAPNADGVERIAPACQSRLVDDRECVFVADGAEPAHLVGIRLACGLFLHRKRKHRSGTARTLRHARAREQHLRGGNHQLDTLGAPRQFRNPAFAGNRFAAVDERPLAALWRIGQRHVDTQQAHSALRQTIAGQVPTFPRASSAVPRACALPMVTRTRAMK